MLFEELHLLHRHGRVLALGDLLAVNVMAQDMHLLPEVFEPKLADLPAIKPSL